MTATDFDLDDDVDLVASTFGSTLNLLENDGSGVFPGPPVKVSSGLSRANALGAVDLDHDDDLDLVVGSYGGSQVVVLLNDGGTLSRSAADHDWRVTLSDRLGGFQRRHAYGSGRG